MKFKLEKDFLNKVLKNKQSRYCILIIFVSIVFAIVLYFQGSEQKRIEDGIIQRPDYTQGTKKVKINAKTSNGDEVDTDLNISPKELSADEALSMFNEMYDLLPDRILNSNSSLSSVNSDLNLMTQLEGYPADIEWRTSNYKIIDYDGKVQNDEFKSDETEKVTLTVSLEYLEYHGENTIDVVVIAKDLTQQEKVRKNITSNMVDAEKNNRNKDSVQLPQVIDEEAVEYSYENDSTSPMVAFILGGIAIVGIVVGKNKEIEKQNNIRKMQLEYDYSEVVSKLNLLVGAGMTVFKAWEKIVLDYQVQIKEKQIQKRFVYEEMLETYNQLKAGIAEFVAYEKFGKRCNTKEYIKLGSLLVQNNKKGTKDLIDMLNAEAKQAFEEHKNIVKKKGEEAGTKLLVPMILMLLVVMIIVIAPALMSFNI